MKSWIYPVLWFAIVAGILALSEISAHDDTMANIEAYRMKAETACIEAGKYFVFREEYANGRFVTACYNHNCKPSI